MKIFNLQRGQGKTMRMLYASEFNNAPILCYNEHSKQYIMDKATKFEIKIPEPITVNDLVKSVRYGDKKMSNILIDEMDAVTSLLFYQLFGMEIIGATITTDKTIGDIK
jgi:hypothetical protein